MYGPPVLCIPGYSIYSVLARPAECYIHIVCIDLSYSYEYKGIDLAGTISRLIKELL
jgi:hypothetical protein